MIMDDKTLLAFEDHRLDLADTAMCVLRHRILCSPNLMERVPRELRVAEDPQELAEGLLDLIESQREWKVK